jgi:hypothetical protein
MAIVSAYTSKWREILASSEGSSEAVNSGQKAPKMPVTEIARGAAQTHTQKTFNTQKPPSDPISVDKMYVSLRGQEPQPAPAEAVKSAVIYEPFACPFCLNDPARCEWCADHPDHTDVVSCGDCVRGKMKRAAVSWRRDPSVPPNSRLPLVPDAVRAIVEGIEADARAQGWPAELLWNSNFWDCPRGLATILDESDVIAEVTPEFIEIIKTKHSILRFPRRVS